MSDTNVDLSQQIVRMGWRTYKAQRKAKLAALTGIPLRRPGRPRKVREPETITVAYTEVSGQEAAQQSA
jgi:hypothetical protein